MKTRADFLRHFTKVKASQGGYTARCPGHADKTSSLSIARGKNDDCWVLKCFAGCSIDDILGAVGLKQADLFDEKANNGKSATWDGLTLSEYAKAKALPVEFLRGLPLADITYLGKPAVRIPYYDETGAEIATRYRVSLGGDRFRWKKGSKAVLYGQTRLPAARIAGSIVLVEGESDCHTFWLHGIPAVGLPGAGTWNEARDAKLLDGVADIIAIIEPDKGGEKVKQWLAESSIRHRTRILSLPTKDVSALYLEDPKRFTDRWKVLSLAATPFATAAEQANLEIRNEAWILCRDLAQLPNILTEFVADLGKLKVAGEQRIAELIFLALISRMFERPVSVAVKGPSSGGKSFVVEQVLRFFPPESYYALTAMSDRALAYSKEPLKHRFLVVYEAAGMKRDFASYLIRSLLSEGRLRYETVEATKNGLKPLVIEREGPTGLLVTTTAVRLHPENETRLLSLTICDTQEQTQTVFEALAGCRSQIDLSRWHALQQWIAAGPAAVEIPYALQLAKLMKPVAIRLRRDFKMLLSFIRAHALLHQANRRTNGNGEIIAEREDYETVRDLLADLIAEGVEATVTPEVRAVVETVAKLANAKIARSSVQQQPDDTVSLGEVTRALNLDKSAVSRRVSKAIEAGYIKNLETRKHQPMRLAIHEPMPGAVDVLPLATDIEVDA